jgi:pyruvate/oxaloacetate carboxyltransferase
VWIPKHLKPFMVKKILLLENPPTTINEWVRKAIMINRQYRATMDIRDYQGLVNPQGLESRVQRVRVRVGISVPLANPYP